MYIYMNYEDRSQVSEVYRMIPSSVCLSVNVISRHDSPKQVLLYGQCVHVITSYINIISDING